LRLSVCHQEKESQAQVEKKKTLLLSNENLLKKDHRADKKKGEVEG